MLVRCPSCKTEFRLKEYQPGERVVRYLCPGCEQIVKIDLAMDEVASSSSAARFETIERALTVLVADDTDAVLSRATALLSDAGYRVLPASDGVDALNKIRDHHPDLVVLDLLMPRMTGFDVLREIRQDPRTKDTKVLAMSGVYKDNVLEFLQQLGAEGFLDKDSIEATLVFRVRQAIGQASGSPE
jgi:twitching motility two-component system response regulator PilG